MTNSKPEARNPKQAQTSNDPILQTCFTKPLSFGHSNLFRVSTFEFRVFFHAGTRTFFTTSSTTPRAVKPEKIQREIASGSMPPRIYLLTHPEARLTDTEKQQLIDGLIASLAH